jgi:hypothetical protein
MGRENENETPFTRALISSFFFFFFSLFLFFFFPDVLDMKCQKILYINILHIYFIIKYITYIIFNHILI